MAINAITPDGYAQVFSNLVQTLVASNLISVTILKSYDTLTCASLCDNASGCQAFNIYAERDPSLDPNSSSCPNPPSTTNYKCSLWGVPISAQEATNSLQYIDQFMVGFTASNGLLSRPKKRAHSLSPFSRIQQGRCASCN